MVRPKKGEIQCHTIGSVTAQILKPSCLGSPFGVKDSCGTCNRVQGSQDPPPLDDTQQNHYNCNYEQNMNQSTHCVRSHYSQQPQDYQNHTDCPQHGAPFEKLNKCSY